MNYFVPYSCNPGVGQYTHWPSSHVLPAIQPPPPPPPPPLPPLTLTVPAVGGFQDPSGHPELHFFYGPAPVPWYYPHHHHHHPSRPQQPCMNHPPPPAGGRGQRQGPRGTTMTVSHRAGPRTKPPVAPATVTWPEGFTLKGELRWGALERVYGPRRELPDFVRADLRRVYGTYPRTDVSVTFQGGEFVVHGNPRVGEQEYRVEKKVVRQLESPEADSVSVVVERRRKKRGTKRLK